MPTRILLPIGLVIFFSVPIAGLTGCGQSRQLTRVAPALSSNSPMNKAGNSLSALANQESIRLQLRLAEAHELEQAGQLDAARQSLRDILQQHGEVPEALHRLAVVLDKQGLYEQSKPLYAVALSHNTQDAQLHCDYGYSCYLQDDFEQAEKSYQAAINCEPRMQRAHNNLAVLLARTGRQQQALRHFGYAGCDQEQATANLNFAIRLQQQVDATRTPSENAIQIAQAGANTTDSTNQSAVGPQNVPEPDPYQTTPTANHAPLRRQTVSAHDLRPPNGSASARETQENLASAGTGEPAAQAQWFGISDQSSDPSQRRATLAGWTEQPPQQVTYAAPTPIANDGASAPAPLPQGPSETTSIPQTARPHKALVAHPAPTAIRVHNPHVLPGPDLVATNGPSLPGPRRTTAIQLASHTDEANAGQRHAGSPIPTQPTTYQFAMDANPLQPKLVDSNGQQELAPIPVNPLGPAIEGTGKEDVSVNQPNQSTRRVERR